MDERVLSDSFSFDRIVIVTSMVFRPHESDPISLDTELA